MKKKRVTAPPAPLSNLAKYERRLKPVLHHFEEDKWALGLMWNELVREKYAEDDAGMQPKAWWETHAERYCDVRTAERLGRVCKRWKSDTLDAEGDSRLDLLIDYCDQHGIPIPAVPGQMIIHFTLNGQSVAKPFSECSTKDMQAATKRAKRPSSGDSDDSSGDGRPEAPTYVQGRWLWFAQTALEDIVEPGEANKGVYYDHDGDKGVFTVAKIPFPKVHAAIDRLSQAYQAFFKENGALE